jgi:NAD-dependent dihydropyrimidine dehydrogenase PreA subunit
VIEVLDQSTCTECGVCLLVCPMDVIARDRRGGYVVRHVEDCMSCFACEMECRPGSIRVGPSRRAKPSLLRAWTRRSTLEGSPPARANQLRG